MSKTSEISNQNSAFDDIIMKFTDRCFVLLENISRENVREEIDTTDISWNSEESTAFTEITSTFQKLVTRLSKKNFTYLLEKLKNYAQSNILEPALAGPMFASLVKGLAIVQPEQTLDFFIPYLCSQIEEILLDKSLFSKVFFCFKKQKYIFSCLDHTFPVQLFYQLYMQETGNLNITSLVQ